MNLGGGDLHTVPKDLLLRAQHKYDDNSIIHLPAGATIKVGASSGSAVDYIVSGVSTV